MDLFEVVFIAADPKWTWIKDIIIDIVRKLPKELFDELLIWDKILTLQPFIYKFNVDEANEILHESKKRKIILKRPIFPLDAAESDQSFKQYTEQRPVRIMIAGDENSLFLELGQMLVNYMASHHITPKKLIQQEINRRSQLGKWLNWNITKERGIPTWVVMKLLEKELKKDKYTHRGYILTGFPIISNKDVLPPFVYHDDEEYDFEDTYFESTSSEKQIEEEQYTEMGTDSISICSNSSTYTTWTLDGDDLLDLVRGKEFIPLDTCPLFNLKNDVQKQLDFLYDLGCKPEYLIYLDTAYHTQPFKHILKILDVFFIYYRRECVIQIDSRIGLQALYQHALNRFLYINYKVNYPCVILNNNKNISMSLEGLCRLDTILPRATWWVSEFDRKCPVSLYNGRLRNCDSKYPVRYLRYIFLLYSSCLRKRFMACPEKYLNLVPTCRFAIIGPHRSGKSTLSDILSQIFRADIYRCHIQQTEENLYSASNDVFTDTELKNELKDLEAWRLQEYTIFKQNKIEEWSSCILSLLGEILIKITKGKKADMPRKIAERYFESIYQPPKSYVGIKQFLLQKAIYNRSVKYFNNKHFLDWVSEYQFTNRLYRQYVLDSAPLNDSFWQTLLASDQMPDCVIFLNISTLKKINDIYNLIHSEKCIRTKMITEYILNNFHEWKDKIETTFHLKSYSEIKMDDSIKALMKYWVVSRYQEATEYVKKYVKLKAFLRNHNIPYFDINIAKASWTETIIKAIHEYMSMYKTKAKPIYELNLDSVSYAGDAELEDQIVSASSSDFDNMTESERQIEDEIPIAKFVNYGHYQDWCPVLFHDENILLKGSTRYSAEYKNKVYVMRSKQALIKFISNPVRYSQIHRFIPPARVFLAGLNTRAKNKFGENLALSLNVTNITCMNRLNPCTYNSFLRPDLSYDEVVSTYEKTKNAFLQYIGTMYEHGILLCGFPLTAAHLLDAFDRKLYPEYVFIFDEEADILMAMFRILARQQTMHYYTTRVGGSTFDADLPESEIQIIKRKCIDIIQPFMMEMKKIEEACRNEGIPVIKVPHSYKYTLKHNYYLEKVNHFRDRRAKFEQVKIITMEDSETLLKSGFYRFSRFKYSCPVDVHRLVAFNHFDGMRKRGLVFPCIYRDYIYFISGQKNLTEFLKRPLVYVNTCNAPQMSYPMRIAVFGPPKSGITTICQKISKDLGFKIYSRKDLFDESIASIIDLLKIRKTETPNGIVLDNINITSELLTEAAKNVTYITLVLIILPSFKQTLENFWNQTCYKKYYPALILPQILHGYCNTLRSIQKLRSCNEVCTFNIRYIYGDFNSWTTWDKVKFEILKTSRCISGYSIKLLKNRCANIGNLNLFYETILFKRDIHFFYCQVCLSIGKLNSYKYFYVNVKEDFYGDECQKMLNRPYGYCDHEIYEKFDFNQPFVPNTLANSITTQDKFLLMSMFQFKDILYWSCSDHSIHFIMYAQNYYKDREKLKPKYIPFLVIGYKKEFVAYDGFCPIEYQKGKNVKGSMNLSVYYRKKVYLLLNRENTIEFLSYPEKYHSVPFDPTLNLNSQEANRFYGINEEFLLKAVLDLVFARPRHFSLSGIQSAATFVAIKLKVKNSPIKYTDYWGTVFRDFMKDCKKLEREIKKFREVVNPYIALE